MTRYSAALARRLTQPQFRVLEAKGGLIMQVKREKERFLSAHDARRAAEKLVKISGETVMLLDRRAEIGGLFNLSVVQKSHVDVSSVRIVVLSRSLGNKLGHWDRGESVSPGMWSVHNFAFAESARAEAWVVREILKPWIDQGAGDDEPDAEADARNSTDPVSTAIALRKRLTDQVLLLDASKWQEWRGTQGTNPSAALGKQKKSGKVFSVKEGRRDLYPAFQFKNGEPLEGMARVLAEVPPDARGWPLLSWFEANNHLLDGQKPSALIASDPTRVAAAARAFYRNE